MLFLIFDNNTNNNDNNNNNNEYDNDNIQSKLYLQSAFILLHCLFLLIWKLIKEGRELEAVWDSIHRSFLSQLVKRCPGTGDAFDDTCWPWGRELFPECVGPSRLRSVQGPGDRVPPLDHRVSWAQPGRRGRATQVTPPPRLTGATVTQSPAVPQRAPRGRARAARSVGHVAERSGAGWRPAAGS
jgi:hypothetical protein